MRSYRSKHTHGVKAKKIIIRTLFVLLAAALITVLSLLLGHHLLSKVEKLDNEENVLPEETAAPSQEPPVELVITSTSAPSVFAVTADVRDYEDSDALVSRIGELSVHYDTLILQLEDTDGGLIYSSPAKCALLGLPVIEDDPVLMMLRAAVKAAKSKGMRLCAAIPSSLGGSTTASAAVIDSSLIAELAEMGFDEVMLQFNRGGEFERKNVLTLRDYLLECDELTSSACHVGLTLPAEYYLEASYAKHLQLIGSAVSFMGIDFSVDGMSTSTEIFSSVSHDITSLLGSFTVYNMRLVINSRDMTAAAAEYTAAIHSNIENMCIMGTYLPEDLAYDQNATVETEAVPETDPAEDSEHKNPYASTGDYYGDSSGNGDSDTPDNTNNDSDKSDKPWY